MSRVIASWRASETGGTIRQKTVSKSYSLPFTRGELRIAVYNTAVDRRDAATHAVHGVIPRGGAGGAYVACVGAEAVLAAAL